MNFNNWFTQRLNALGDYDSAALKKVFEEFDQKLICPDFSSLDELVDFADINFYIGSVASPDCPRRYSWISRTKTNGFMVPNPLLSNAEHYFCLWIKENRLESLNSFLEKDNFKIAYRLTGGSILSGEFRLLVPSSYGTAKPARPDPVVENKFDALGQEDFK